MVFAILLGLLDVLMGALMVAMHLGAIDSWRVALMGFVYLFGKGIVFRGSFLSIIDMLAGVYFILILLGVRTFLVYVFLGVMIYKFLVSLILRG